MSETPRSDSMRSAGDVLECPQCDTGAFEAAKLNNADRREMATSPAEERNNPDQLVLACNACGCELLFNLQS